MLFFPRGEGSRFATAIPNVNLTILEQAKNNVLTTIKFQNSNESDGDVDNLTSDVVSNIREDKNRTDDCKYYGGYDHTSKSDSTRVAMISFKDFVYAILKEYYKLMT